MKTKSIKQVFEQLERIKEFARSRNKFISRQKKSYQNENKTRIIELLILNYY